MKYFIVALLASISLSACQTAQYHTNDVKSADSDKLTMGTVQREIRVGMSSADVVSALGSPNMVTTDDQRREVWVYDKIATENAYSTSNVGTGGILSLLLIGGGKSAGASSTTQKNLTVIVKFDENSKVRDFAYHQSSF